MNRRLAAFFAFCAVCLLGAGILVTATTVTISGTYVRLQDSAWDDLRIVPAATDFPGVSDPDLVDYTPGGSGTSLKLYEYAKGDYVTFLCQLPHNRKPESDLKAHIHWTPSTQGNEEIGHVVAWQVEYSAASIGSAFPTMQALDLKDTVTGTDGLHEITSGATIAGSALGLSSIVLCKLSRISTNDTWSGTTTGNLPIMLEFDIHYEIDRFGSDNEASND